MASATVAQPRDVMRGTPAGLAKPTAPRPANQQQSKVPSSMTMSEAKSKVGAVKTPPELPARPTNKNAPSTVDSFSKAPSMAMKASGNAPPALPVRVPKKTSTMKPAAAIKMPSSKPLFSPVSNERNAFFAPSSSIAATSTSTRLPVPARGKSIVDPKSASDAPRTLSQRMTNLMQRRPSAANQESSAMRRPSVMAIMLRKKNSAEEDESTTKRRSQMIAGQNNNGNRQLSMHLSFARGSVTDQALAKPGPSRKKSDAIVFTKKEMRSIRLAATEAKAINWAEDESRTSDDTTSLYSGGEDADPRKRPTLVLNVDSMYKQKDAGLKSRNGSFEYSNPSQDDSHFGMFIFSAATDSTLHEEEEDE